MRITLFKLPEKLIAVVYGALCHGLFLCAGILMFVCLFTGFSGQLVPSFFYSHYVFNVFLLLQFPFLHSFLLTKPGRKILRWFYSDNYQLDPNSTNWEELVSANTEIDSNKSVDENFTDQYDLEVDISDIEGASITFGIKYTSISQNPSATRLWIVSNPSIIATLTTTIIVGGNGADASFYRLRAENLGF